MPDQKQGKITPSMGHETSHCSKESKNRCPRKATPMARDFEPLPTRVIKILCYQLFYRLVQFQKDGNQSFDAEDPRFLRFVDDLARIIVNMGFDWMDVRGIANIANAFATLGLRTESAKQIMAFICERKNAHALVTNENALDIASLCWSIARLVELGEDIDPFCEEATEMQAIFFVLATKGSSLCIQHAPILFAEMEKRSVRLVANGNASTVANMAGACAVMGLQSPVLFQEIERHATWLVENGSTKVVARMAWACARFDISSPRLFRPPCAPSFGPIRRHNRSCLWRLFLDSCFSWHSHRHVCQHREQCRETMEQHH
jgi:hypothetical protein